MTLPIKRTEGSGLDWPRFEYLILLILSLSNSCIYTANVCRKIKSNICEFHTNLVKIDALQMFKDELKQISVYFTQI